MKLGELLESIKDLDPELGVYIHEIDDQGAVHFKPMRGVSLQVTDKKLSFGYEDFNWVLYKKLQKKGHYL